jgi:hypothetical protein
MHLGGLGNVRDLLNQGKVFRDGFGTPITEYVTKFSGFDLDRKEEPQ